MRSLALIAATIAAAANTAQAWWCDGHMLVANIAWNSGIMSSTTQQAANDLIQYLADDYTASPDFVSSACWADDLKAMGARQEADWHFINLPIVRQPFAGPVPAMNPNNAPWAIKEGEATLFSSKSIQLDQARQLRFLIHIIGDIHQPLHSAELFSSEFPTGDLGGNLYNISGVSYTSELHAVWDAGAGLWYGDISRPLNQTGLDWVNNMSNNIMGQWPVSSLQPYIQEYNTTQWAVESFDIASTFTYTAPQADQGPLSSDYLNKAQSICQKQIAIAAYRLADLLEYIFNGGEARRAEYLTPQNVPVVKDGNVLVAKHPMEHEAAHPFTPVVA